MKHSEQLEHLATALAAAQGEMDAAKKDMTNPHFKSKYADLASVWDAIRGPLSKHGLSVVQLPDEEGGRVSVTTIIMHKSGQWIEASYALPPTKGDPQGFGSAITYMKRYALTGVGVAPEDDDGNAASKRDDGPVTPYSSAPTKPPKQNDQNDLAARKWQAEALTTLRAFNDIADLKAWEDKNDRAIQKLNTASETLYRELIGALGDAYERLNPMAAE